MKLSVCALNERVILLGVEDWSMDRCAGLRAMLQLRQENDPALAEFSFIVLPLAIEAVNLPQDAEVRAYLETIVNSLLDKRSEALM